MADLHLARSSFPDDQTIATLVEDLHHASDRFARLWATRPVDVHVSDTKTVHRRRVGPITLNCDLFTVPDSDVRIVQFTPLVGNATQRLASVSTIATQEFGDDLSDARGERWGLVPHLLHWSASVPDLTPVVRGPRSGTSAH